MGRSKQYGLAWAFPFILSTMASSSSHLATLPSTASLGGNVVPNLQFRCKRHVETLERTAGNENVLDQPAPRERIESRSQHWVFQRSPPAPPLENPRLRRLLLSALPSALRAAFLSSARSPRRWRRCPWLRWRVFRAGRACASFCRGWALRSLRRRRSRCR